MSDIKIDSTWRDSSLRKAQALQIVERTLKNHKIKTRQPIGCSPFIAKGFAGLGTKQVAYGVGGWGDTMEFWVNVYDDTFLPLFKEIAAEIKSRTGMGAIINLC